MHLDDNGLILFKDSQYIYLDKDYNKYVLGKLNEPKRFMKGIGVEKAVDLYNHFKFINLKGEAITPYYSDVFPFYENVGMARNDSNLWAIINKEGKAITPFKYESILMDHGNQLYKDVHTGYEFSNPFLVTGKPIFARSAEYIDMFDGNGNQLNPISYNRLELCGRYIIAGLQKNKYEIRYGILNDKFQILVPFEYEQIKFYNLLKEKYFELKDLNHQFHNISLEEINKKQPH